MAQQFGLSVILKLIDQISGPLSKVNTQFEKAGAAWSRTANGLKEAGKNMTLYVTAPLAGMGYFATKAAVDFESAFTGVVKTVNATAEELEVLRTGFLQMAKEVPLSTEELYKIGEAAGQLGIKTENILGFSRVMADLGATTNLASADAATQLARFANIVGMSQKDFDKLGSTIVALGNNSATTEAEIVSMGMRLAGAGKQVGLSEHVIMSLAAALSSVGLEAEAGGTAFSRVMIEMNKAVAKNSKELGIFEKVAQKGGLKGSFKDAFKKDAISAMQNFIEGMKNLSDNGVNVSLILDAIGMDGIRVSDSLMRASGAGKLLNDTLKVGAEGWEKNLALTREAELRYKTAESQMKILNNEVKQMSASFGDVMVPILLRLISVVKPAVDGISKLSPVTKELIVVLGGMLALAGPLMSFVVLISKFAAVMTAIGLGVAPLLAIAAAFTAVAVAISQLIKHWQTLTAGGFLDIAKDFAKWMGYLVTGGAYFNPEDPTGAQRRQGARWQPAFPQVSGANKIAVNSSNQSEVKVIVESAEGLRAKVKSVKSDDGINTSAFTSGYAGVMGTPLPEGGY